MITYIRILIHSPLANAAIAGIAYGAWAYIVNMDHDQDASIMAACMQGISSFIFTLIITSIALKLYIYCHDSKQGIIFGWIGSVALLIIFPALLHYLVGTPDIIETVAPGIIIGSVYILALLLHYQKTHDV